MKKLVLFIMLFTVSACASMTRITNSHFVDSVKKIPLGASEQKLISIMGAPNKREPEDGGQRLTYTIPYKKMALPKVTVWLDNKGFVEAKSINLFEEDEMNLLQTKNFFKFSELKIQPLDLKGKHYIPSERYFRNEDVGLSLEVRPRKDYEGNTFGVLADKDYRVSRISWYTPSRQISLKK